MCTLTLTHPSKHPCRRSLSLLSGEILFPCFPSACLQQASRTFYKVRSLMLNRFQAEIQGTPVGISVYLGVVVSWCDGC